ncbi:MAG: hypothetical protein IJ948_04290 [Clostridia bacterium]|nr:hypothetical protein [Clostridia bacterium]
MAYLNGKEILFSPQIIENGTGNNGYDQGYEDGKNSVVQFEKCLTGGTFRNLHILGKAEVELNLDKFTSFQYLTGVTEGENTVLTHLTLNCPNFVTDALGMFNWSSDNNLRHITLNVDFQKCSRFNGAFHNLKALEIIDGLPLNLSSATGTSLNMFNGYHTKLKEIRFVANSIPLNPNFANCSLLSDESVQNIIDGLMDLTDKTAQTITFHADVGGRLTDEQKATITAKNWILAY